ncbi:hypothetical protein [Mucilaginibacter phyllosphaerae]|uniref:Uncharacterized protein n=1 Tax=Mucilaginibacter phyllosphaerae TaxID=1812349 RepID=A0A4Y8AJE1_9SPHI|nr:hypothetical protein [Mucilaginibacter phyllosphaerae]MBB3967822.1 hypothetical protein [Mucilaginibacter phyllosphaerae]TEW69133.1 hypothetical protein E2R65_02910 [Mucilaginibacter phyllosphaerae]GGH03064.1 hypothetical protein GCM10007352_05610 [Mucilaginibacter phyllosphaerae]
MNRQIEKLKKQLTEIAEVVNSFQSEAVQVRVVDRLLDEIMETEKGDTEGADIFNKRGRRPSRENEVTELTQGRKKLGATKVLNQLLSSDYFKTPHSISSIADYCKEKFDSDFKTSELSGILLKLAKENRLKRERSNENNRFEYVGV